MADHSRRKAYISYLEMVGIDHIPLNGAGREIEAEREGIGDAGETQESRLAALLANIGPCTRCRLHEGRRNIVFGVGNPEASIMFIGEGPGADEDRMGEPFVGAAGKRLDVWISKLGLKRDDVYIANIVKCRPPGNRTPKPDEAATCIPFLKKQIEIVSPRLIVTLGGPALNNLLGRDERITRVRGTLFYHDGIPVLPTFHPAYILRNPAKEKEVFLDLDLIVKTIDK